MPGKKRTLNAEDSGLGKMGISEVTELPSVPRVGGGRKPNFNPFEDDVVASYENETIFKLTGVEDPKKTRELLHNAAARHDIGVDVRETGVEGELVFKARDRQQRPRKEKAETA